MIIIQPFKPSFFLLLIRTIKIIIICFNEIWPLWICFFFVLLWNVFFLFQKIQQNNLQINKKNLWTVSLWSWISWMNFARKPFLNILLTRVNTIIIIFSQLTTTIIIIIIMMMTTRVWGNGFFCFHHNIWYNWKFLI